MEIDIQLTPADYAESQRIYADYDPGFFKQQRRSIILNAMMSLTATIALFVGTGAWVLMLLIIALGGTQLAQPYLRRRKALKALSNSIPLKLRIGALAEGERLIIANDSYDSIMQWKYLPGWKVRTCSC
jgi:hypothetical protein